MGLSAIIFVIGVQVWILIQYVQGIDNNIIRRFSMRKNYEKPMLNASIEGTLEGVYAFGVNCLCPCPWPTDPQPSSKKSANGDGGNATPTVHVWYYWWDVFRLFPHYY